MKKYYLIIAMLAAVNIVLSVGCAKSSNERIGQNEDVTALADGVTEETDESTGADKKVTCLSGGIGATECKIGGGHKIGDIITEGCSISCGEGTYACCGERCVCIEYES